MTALCLLLGAISGALLVLVFPHVFSLYRVRDFSESHREAYVNGFAEAMKHDKLCDWYRTALECYLRYMTKRGGA